MAPLLDVNILIAAAWESHSEHKTVRKWLLELDEFVTCPISELGFIRVSMTPAFSASFEDACHFLTAIQALPGATRIDDNMNPVSTAPVQSYKDTTDSYLVSLAAKHDMRLATLDSALLKKSWAVGMTFNPVESES